MKRNEEKSMFAGASLVVALLASLLAAPAGAAPVDLFMDIDGVEGESTDDRHKRWIDISSVGWVVARAGDTGAVGSTRTRGAAQFEDLTWTQVMDKSFPKVFEAVADGTIFPFVDIDFQTQIGSSDVVFFNMHFESVGMTGIALEGTTQGPPTVAGSFNYEAVTVTYSQFDREGKKLGDISASWDLETASAANVGALFGLALSGASVVPVPAAVWLFGSGLLALGGYRRHQRSAQAVA